MFLQIKSISLGSDTIVHPITVAIPLWPSGGGSVGIHSPADDNNLSYFSIFFISALERKEYETLELVLFGMVKIHS